MEEALRYRKNKLSIIATEIQSKKPISAIRETGWKKYQYEIPPEGLVRSWLNSNNCGIAAICGLVSENLEDLDFDFLAGLFEAWKNLVWQELPDLLEKLVIQKTQSAGIAVVYRCTERVPGNKELARKKIPVDGPGDHTYMNKTLKARQEGDEWFIYPVFIETRGEAGYFLLFPSAGYELIQGDFGNIPVITGQQRKILIRCARLLDEAPDENNLVTGGLNRKPGGNGIRPGDDYNSKHGIAELIEAAGWERTGKSPKGILYRRPGKKGGNSASVFDDKIFHNFSSNAYPFEPNKSYTSFAVYALLNHGKDYSAAAKALAAKGYGEWEPVKQIPGLESKTVIDTLYRNEDGDAELFIQLNRDNFTYDHVERNWYIWQEHFWRKDITGECYRALDEVIRCYRAEYSALSKQVEESAERGQKDSSSQKVQGELLKRLRLLHSGKRKKNVLEIATWGAGSLGIDGTQWDQHPYLLPCLNGVIDLKTGELNPGPQKQYIRNVCPVVYDPDAPAPVVFIKSLNEIFENNQEPISFLKRVVGHALIGAQIEHILIILEGVGRNGKDTLVKGFSKPLGDFASPVVSELFLDQSGWKSSSGPRQEIVELQGKRIVFANETNEGRRFNTGVVKWITGGSEIIGRGNYARHQVRFTPSHTTFLMTNHKPKAPAEDYALWSRIHCIPFNMKFVDQPVESDERKADRFLEYKLYGEAPAILKWMVEGCLEYQKTGLNPPEIVKAAVADYRDRENLIDEFLTNHTVEDVNGGVSASQLFTLFTEFCDQKKIKRLTQTGFGNLIKHRYNSKKTNIGIIYEGLRLL